MDLIGLPLLSSCRRSWAYRTKDGKKTLENINRGKNETEGKADERTVELLIEKGFLQGKLVQITIFLLSSLISVHFLMQPTL